MTHTFFRSFKKHRIFSNFRIGDRPIYLIICYSLANNKTVVHLQGKSTTGSGCFTGVYIWDFCRWVWSISKFFCLLLFCRYWYIAV